MQAYIPWITFFIGIVVGWLLTWLMMTGNKRDLEARVSQLEADLQDRDVEISACHEESTLKAAEFQTEIKSLKSELKTTTSTFETLSAELEARTLELEACAAEKELLGAQNEEMVALAAAGAVDARSTAIEIGIEEPAVDDFTQIKGIGPALAARLSAAGIFRYRDLAEADADELPNALGIQPWQKVEPDVWVAEAAVLAEQPDQVHFGDDLTLLEGIGLTYAARLRAAGITTFDQLGRSEEETLAIIIGAPVWRRVNYGDWIAQARLAAAGDEDGLKDLQDRLFSRQGDNLGLVSGVGTQSLAVLHEGGIETYVALAATDPAVLAVMFTDAGVRAGDFEAWIAEAKLRAAGKRVKRSRSRLPKLDSIQTRSCPQDLELIYGVGSVYEQRLYAVGVGSFWEVGMLPEALLNEILEVEEFQDVDLAAIKADALRLAEKTDSMGHTWDGTEPDNFEPLVGIGPVLERRLYGAGICTFEALASASVELLEKVCHAPAFQQPDYALWIEQAKKLSS